MRPLSWRQFQAARLIGKGLNNREIAEKMGIPYVAVKSVVYEVLLKTGARDRVQLGIWMNCELFLSGLPVVSPKDKEPL